MFTFLSVISQNFEYSLRILANFRVKTQKSTDFARTFSKNCSFFFGFFNKAYTFYTKNLFFTTKDAQSMLKNSFLVTCSHFEYNFRIFANFPVKTQKSMDFTRRFPKTNIFFLVGGIF